MVNRTATYIAFDGLGETDPTKSDFKFYATIQAWDAHKSIDFSFVNSHEKTDAVRDTSKMATLKSRIQERLRCSKNVVVILSKDTRKSGSMLSYEIEQAVDNYKLPLIIVYTGYCVVRKFTPILMSHWPTALNARLHEFYTISGEHVANKITNAIHIPFAKDPLMYTIERFTVNGGGIVGPRNTFSQDAYVGWNLMKPTDEDSNYLKK